MFESIVNPKRMDKGPLKMLFIGLIYATLSLGIVKFAFSGDPVLSQYSGMIVVTFCVMFSLPFMYFLIKQEEEEDEVVEGFFRVWKMHSDAVYSFMFLFLGFVLAFSFWYIIIGDSTLFNAQIETYCMINSPGNIEGCVEKYDFSQKITGTGAATKEMRLLSIIENNIYVMIFTLIFSLIFGAVGIFTNYSLSGIPMGIVRYMIHGFPEIAAYFITALAGGIFGVGAIRNGFKSQKFLRVVENSIILLFIAIIIIIVAGFIEVYFTPILFN